MIKQHTIIIGFLLLGLGSALHPTSGFSQEQNEDELIKLIEASEREVVRRRPPVPLAEEVIRETQPPRGEEPPPFDPCRPFEQDRENYARCLKCASAVYGPDITALEARQDRDGKDLLGCCIAGVLDIKDVMERESRGAELIQQCRCDSNPSALTCMGCLATQQVDYMGACYEDLIPQAIDSRAKIKISAGQRAEITFTKKVELNVKLDERLKDAKYPPGAEAPGDRTIDFTADTPLCGCAAPQAVEEAAGVCHRDFLRNVLSFPCLHPQQEEDARKFIERMIATMPEQTRVDLESLSYSPSSQSFDVTFVALPSQCKELRGSAFSRPPLEKAVLQKGLEAARADRIPLEKTRESVETSESCSISIPECLCNAPLDLPPELADGTTTTAKPTAPEQETPLIQTEQDEHLFVCREGSTFAVDVDNCQLIWLGHDGQERCPEVPLELAIEPDMIQLSEKVAACERGDILSLNEMFPRILQYIKVWKGLVVPEGKKLDMPHPPIRAFQFADSVGGEPFARTSPITPDAVTLEEPATSPSSDDPIVVAGGPSSGPRVGHKARVKIRVFPPVNLPNTDSPQQPVNGGPNSNDIDGDSSGQATNPVIKLTSTEASAAIEEQVAPTYLLLATGATGVSGGGCSLKR